MTAPAGSRSVTERTPRIVAAGKLSRRRDRERAGSFLVEGPQAVREALARPGAMQELFVTETARARHGGVIEQAEAAGVRISLATDRAVAGLAETGHPQGLVGTCRFVDVSLAEAIGPASRLVAVLVRVQDPGNAGTVLRCADAAGAGAVVFSGESVDPYNGKCVRASAGSLFHLPVARDAAGSDAVDQARAAGLQVLATTPEGAADLDDLADAGDLAAPTAWLLGNEAHGLDPAVAALADRTVRIPIHGRAESLNLATAAAICLYASARAQRRTADGARRSRP